jgi:hypothetical protein
MPVLYKDAEAEELDAEMVDYFPTAEGNKDAMATNATGDAQTAACGNTAMDDKML